MAVATKPRSMERPEGLDLATMRSWRDAPTVAPLLSRRVSLQQRLQEINASVIAARRELYALRENESYTALSQQRLFNARLVALEEEAVPLEQALAALNPEIEAEEIRVKAELKRLLVPVGLPINEALREDLERLG